MIQAYNISSRRCGNDSTKTDLSPSLEEIAEEMSLTIEKDPAGLHEITKQALNDPLLKEIGKEVVNGMNTRIIEYNYNEQTIKAWISEEYGIAVKKQTQTQIGKDLVQQTTELTNIKIGQVSNSLFEIN